MAAQAEIRCHLAGLTAQRHHGTLIGVAGTLTTLAALDLQTETYDPDLVTGHRLAKETVDHWYERLAQMTHHEIRSHKQILPGRADILLAGVMILREVMEHLGCREIVASDRGLRYGLALSVV
jgi:exopolyphosphatase/guanosine-5'-triphosphate,3'-diphosphate pyrophosphatase